jgi:hypothetical protein
MRTRVTAANDGIAKRKAPDAFIKGLFSLIAEIARRAGEKGQPFDPAAMPGRKTNFQELADRWDPNLKVAKRTFDDYIHGLCQFKNGVKPSTFYRELFPDLLK